MYVPRLMVFDPDDYTASVLQDMLAVRGFVAPVVHEEHLLDDETLRCKPDVLVFNYHFGRHSCLEILARMRNRPEPPAIMALAAPGAAARDLRDWIARTGAIDTVIEKPLTDEGFDSALREMKDIVSRRARTAPRETADVGARARLLELAVLATNVRRNHAASGDLQPSAYFESIAAMLAEHDRVIRAAQGTVLRRSGGGLIATFAGPARTHLALRCSLKLLAARATVNHAEASHFSIGVSNGLVLAGFLGNGSGVRYDIAGATVDQAIALARIAGPGHIVTNAATLEAARFPASALALRRLAPAGAEGDLYSISGATAYAEPPPAHSRVRGAVL
jgi:class 3 adenylate cyclase